MFDDPVGSGYAGRELDVTGPRLLTFGAAIAELARRTGRAIDYRPIEGERFAEMLRRAGMPREEADALVRGFAEILDGRNAYVTEDVERILGRRPRDFSDISLG